MSEKQSKSSRAIRMAVGIITGSAYARMSPQLLAAADELDALGQLVDELIDDPPPMTEGDDWLSRAKQLRGK